MDNKDQFEFSFKMLEYFQNEFFFRQKHYWSTLIRLFSLTVIITILPIASEIYGIVLNDLPKQYLLCFPGVGLTIAILTLVLLRNEARKIKAVNEAKYRINKQCMSPEYHYVFYNVEVGQEMESKKHKWLSFQMPWLVFSLELIIIAVVFVLISTTQLVV